MNVAAFLPNWIGDAVMATPALRALRTTFPQGKLFAVARSYVAGVLEGSSWFDGLILDDGLLSVARRLRRHRIDVAVLFPNSFRSALMARLGGCRERIGYARYGRSLLLTDALPPVRDKQGRLKPSPVIDAYNVLALAAGCPWPGYRMELWTTPADEGQADRVWEQTGVGRYAHVVCLNPGGAFGASKHWPTRHFAELARSLATRRGCGVLVLCGPSERDESRAIVAQADHPAVHGLCDFPLSLGLTKACVRRADLLVSTDSGPRHFAAAFGRPVVTLFGPTHVAWTETFQPLTVHLQKDVPCGPCQLRTCPLDHRCMTSLTPGEAFKAAAGLLDRAAWKGTAAA